MAQTVDIQRGPSGAQATLEAAHAKVMADTSIQHAHIDALIKPPKRSAWMEWLADFLQAASPLITILFWVGIALLLGLLAYFILTEIMGIKLFAPKQKPDPIGQAPQWRPQAKEARDLLAAADALASEGRYGEAVRLILLRSIEHIDRFRPMVVRPALTARDIGAMPALPDQARPTFMRIAGAVERTLFAGLSIDQDEFGSCREAYANFALPDGWRT
jgi:hypothetical protein